MTDDWGRPVETTGEFATPAKLQGHLLILYPIGYVPHIQTKFSRPDKRSDAVCVDVVDLDDKEETTGQSGKIYRNCNFMQGHLIAALRPMIGSRILGVLTLGVGKGGMNAPWIVVDMLDNQAAKERAITWGQANPGFKPSTFVLRVENPVPPVPDPWVQQQQQQPQAQPAQPQYQQPQPTQYTQPPAYQPNPQPQVQPWQPPQQPPQPPAQAAPPPYMAPVQGAPQLNQQEMTMLQQMRQEAARKSAEQQQQFGDNPPF